ncbi:MAG: hypothetical protein R6X20_01670 [Phycisphaerae bacterium]
MSESASPAPGMSLPEVPSRDRLAMPAIVAAVLGACGTLLGMGLGMASGWAHEADIPLGVWFLGQSVLSLLAWAAGTAGLIVGVVVAVRSKGSRRAGYAAIAIVLVVWLLMHLVGVVHALVMLAEGV